MDMLKFAADGGYRENRTVADRAAAMSATRAVRTRKPVPGSRTVHRLKVRHYAQGLKVEPTPDPTPDERAQLLALLDDRANVPTLHDRPLTGVPFSCDLPVLPKGATHAEITAWKHEYRAMIAERGQMLANTRGEYKPVRMVEPSWSLRDQI